MWEGERGERRGGCERAREKGRGRGEEGEGGAEGRENKLYAHMGLVKSFSELHHADSSVFFRVSFRASTETESLI